MDNINNCQTFNNALAEIKLLMRSFDQGLKGYIANPANEDVFAVSKNLADLHEAFLQDYRTAVFEMLNKWISSMGDQSNADFPMSLLDDDVEFEDSGRVVIKRNISIHTNANYMPSLIRKIVGGFVVDNGSNVESADFLEETKGVVRVYEQKFTSMKRLRTARFAEINCPIENLESLESTEQMFHLQNTKISSLPRLKSTGLFQVDHDQITDSKSLDLPAIQKVDGSFNVIGLNKIHAPHLESVHGLMSIQKSGLESFRAAFPKLKSVGTAADFSIMVPNEEMKEEVEELKRKGDLLYDGPVRVSSNG